MGHVPTFEEDPRDIIIDEPLKTTVYYGQFERINESKSYILELSTGDRLLISIITPDPSSEIKARLINPYGFDTIIPSYKAGNAVYEPFAPTYFYELAKQDQTIDRAGEYALEVTVKDGSGKIAVTFGYLEKFTLREWLGVPLKSLRIYQWTGQSWPFILAPFVLPLVIGFNLLRKRYNPIETPLTALKNLTGFIYLGSAAVMLQQMIVSLLKTGLTLQIILTLFFVVGGAAIGLLIMRISSLPLSFSSRLRLSIIGVIGLLIWAGFILGPLLTFLLSVLPNWKNIKNSG
jgi:hypothetical protein